MRFYILIILLNIISCKTSQTKYPTKYNLAGNNLTEIPDTILRRKNITYLNLGAPWTISDPFLNSAVASKNNLTSLPKEICGLTKLRILNLSYNNIQEVPQCFSKLINLEELDLSYNVSLNLIKTIKEVNKLEKLKKLILFGVLQEISDSTKLRAQIRSDIKVLITKYDLLNYR